MGFRTGAFVTVWEVESVGDTRTKARVSISRKNKQTGAYDQDFSGYINFIGSACAAQALSLKEKDRIKLGDCDLSTWYDKEKKITYYQPKVFSFEKVDSGQSGVTVEVDSGEQDGYTEDSHLPF